MLHCNKWQTSESKQLSALNSCWCNKTWICDRSSCTKPYFSNTGGMLRIGVLNFHLCQISTQILKAWFQKLPVQTWSHLGNQHGWISLTPHSIFQSSGQEGITLPCWRWWQLQVLQSPECLCLPSLSGVSACESTHLLPCDLLQLPQKHCWSLVLCEKRDGSNWGYIWVRIIGSSASKRNTISFPFTVTLT